MKQTKVEFSEYLRRLKSSDPLTYEEAYHAVLEHLPEYKDWLVEAMLEEVQPNIRARMIELLGQCNDPNLIPLFKAELLSKDDDVISWTLSALEEMNSPEARAIAKAFRLENEKWRG